MFLSTVTGDGNSLATTWGRLAWRSWNVASVPGARDAPVRLPCSRNLTQLDLLASCRCSAFDGIRPCESPSHLEHWTGAPPATNQPICELVKPSTQLVLAHLGVATRSPEQHERQQDEQFPTSGLHESVMTQHSIVERLQSHSCRLSKSSSHLEWTALQHRETSVENFCQIDIIHCLPPCIGQG